MSGRHVVLKQTDVVVIHLHHGGQRQFSPEARAGLAEIQQQPALGIENLDNLRGRIHDIRQSRAIDGNALGTGERARRQAVLADRAQIFSIQIINLH